jgi:uncharacterized membrane protein
MAVVMALLVADALAQHGTLSVDAAGTADWLERLPHRITRAIEFGGIAVIVIGALAATVTYLRRWIGGGRGDAPYREFRRGLGRSILLGLEFLVAADIIATVAIEPSLHSLAVLAGIVLIRTFLSIALDVEIEGRWPWQKAA